MASTSSVFRLPDSDEHENVANQERLLPKKHLEGMVNTRTNVPDSQTAAALFADALFVVARLEWLKKHFGPQSPVCAAVNAFRVPVCFIRRSALVHDVDQWTDPTRSYALKFDNEIKRASVPVVTRTNTVTDSVPPDLRASAYEIRYLSLIELAMLSMTSTSRFSLPTDDKSACGLANAVSPEGKDLLPDAKSFDVRPDFPRDACATWEAKAMMQWTRMCKRLGLPDGIDQPFDARRSVVEAVRGLYPGGNDAEDDVSTSFVDSRVRVFSMQVFYDDNADDNAEDCRYSDAVQFRLQNMCMRTTTEVRGRVAPKVPAYLFDPKYDVGTGAGTAQTISDAEAWHETISERLTFALDAFGKPIKTRGDIRRFFGTKKRQADFERLLDAHSKALGATPNFRAVSSTLLTAICLLLDDLEQAGDNPDALRRIFPTAYRRWAYSPHTEDLRRHTKLLASQRNEESNYNDFEFDAERPDDVRSGNWMYEPASGASIFYTEYFARALAPSGTEADGARPTSDFAPWLPLNFRRYRDPNDRLRSFERAFARECNRTTSMCRPLYAFGERAVSAADIGLTGVYRGSLLAFAFDPIQSIDSNVDNTFHALFQSTRRDRHENPFYNFFMGAFYYIVNADAQDRAQTKPEVAKFVDKMLVQACCDRHGDDLDRMRRATNVKTNSAVRCAIKSGLASAKRQSWIKFRSALLLDSSRARNIVTVACDTVSQYILCAAPFDRGVNRRSEEIDAASSPKIPFSEIFSTAYDYGLHLNYTIEASIERKRQYDARFLLKNANVDTSVVEGERDNKINSDEIEDVSGNDKHASQDVLETDLMRNVDGNDEKEGIHNGDEDDEDGEDDDEETEDINNNRIDGDDESNDEETPGVASSVKRRRGSSLSKRRRTHVKRRRTTSRGHCGKFFGDVSSNNVVARRRSGVRRSILTYPS